VQKKHKCAKSDASTSTEVNFVATGSDQVRANGMQDSTVSCDVKRLRACGSEAKSKIVKNKNGRP
jgi:hypothetical protein